MFGYTSPFVDTVYRLVVEFANLDNDAAYYTRMDFPDQCASGTLKAIKKVFGEVAPPPPPEVTKIEEKVVHAYQGAIIREQPNTMAKIKATYKKRTALRVVATANDGQMVAGSDVWYQIKSKGPSNKGFVHSSGLERRETV